VYNHQIIYFIKRLLQIHFNLQDVNEIIFINEKKMNYILGNPDAGNVAGWTNYPIVPVTVSSKKEIEKF